MAITDAMIEAGCEQRHGKRTSRRALKDPGMELWVSTRQDMMRRILAAATGVGERDANDVWEDYLREVPEGAARSLQSALAFGYDAGRS